MTLTSIPLAERVRPEKIEDILGQDHLLGPRSALMRALKSGHVFSVILWGPPGSGKTTLARLIAKYTENPFRSFSAVTSGLKELRDIITEAEGAKQNSGKPTILFVDEIHRFNKAQQDAFLPHVENGLIVLVGATTQNPSFEVIPPLLSRARVMTLHPLKKEDLKTILLRAIENKDSGMKDTVI
jgi:putative ATPase